MNILVLNLALRPYSPVKLFPVGLGYVVTAMHNAGYSFDVIDIDAHRYTADEVRRIISIKHYDVVCLGCVVTGYKMVKEMVGEIRSIHAEAKIIVGNSVATSILDTILTKTETDIAVCGEGDITIVELLQTIQDRNSLHNVDGIAFIEDGHVVRTKPRDVIKDISSIPLLNFDLLDTEIYIENTKQSARDDMPFPRETMRAIPCNTARGCIGKCTFCYHNFQGEPYRHRTARSIIDEIKQSIEKYHVNYISFWDELTFFNRRQTLEFVELVEKEGVRFYWDANCRGNLFSEENDLEILRRMRGIGCLSLSYSLESADADILRMMNKHVTVEQFSRQTSLIHRAGITPYTSLVLGYPSETPDTINSTFDCCIENGIYPSAGYLLPQPGSGMYEYALACGYIPDEEKYLLTLGDRQDLRLNMTTMSDEVFKAVVLEGLARCNTILGVGLREENLVKTQYYRSAQQTDNGGKR